MNIIELQGIGKKYSVNVGRRNSDTLRDKIQLRFMNKSKKLSTNEKELKEFWALQDINLQIKKGERIGILGRNGAGKSTLLKVISRVVFPTIGKMEINGRVTSLLEVGTGFHPELSGRENIFLNGSILGMRKDEIINNFDEIVKFAGVEDFVDIPVKRYSSGMYVRLAFSVAAHLQSDVLIVDEVLAVGDLDFQNKCLGKMNEISNSGRTLLFVSHNLQTIKKLCDKSIYLRNGKIEFFGSTSDAINLYLDKSSLNSTANACWSERTGSGKIRYTEIFTRNSNKVITNTFSMGDEVNVVLGYKVHEKVQQCYCSVELWNEDGVKLANIVSFDSNFYPKINLKDHKVNLKLDDFRFYPGKFSLNIWVGDAITHETYDYVFNVYTLEVIDGGSLVNRRLNKESGLILLTPEWEICN